ncbi:MAG: hypothetical protein ACKO40_04765 [Planctomycetaceae bacterium]
MQRQTRTWLDGLVEFAAIHRQQTPLALPGADCHAWASERSILGASLAARLAELDAVRMARRSLSGVDDDPAVVVTTSAAGAAAVGDLLMPGSDIGLLAGGRVVPVTELEYRLWCIRHPDEAHLHHVNLWSWVKTSVPRQRWLEFAAWPLSDGDTYWIHREGLSGAGDLDRRASHLWRWDGRHASLLKAFITERAAPRLGDARS